MLSKILLQESSLYDAAQEIDYLDKVVLETLRLHSPAGRYGICSIYTVNLTVTIVMVIEGLT